jgi:hypothetical protein
MVSNVKNRFRDANKKIKTNKTVWIWHTWKPQK